MKALIRAVSVQDGGYLAKLLLDRGCDVVETSIDAMLTSFGNFNRLKIQNKHALTSMVINDFRSVLKTIERHHPDEIYSLASYTAQRSLLRL